MFRELAVEISNIFTGNRKRIVFCCYAGAPYEAVQFLEALGVRVWPTHDIRPLEDGTMECVLLVAESQYRYAAGLIEGYPGCKCLDPHPVQPIQPKHSWGRPNRSAGGVLTTVLRTLAPTEAKLPPVKMPVNSRHIGRKLTK